MNATILMIIGLVCLLIPASLVATFVAFKDTHQYSRHYSEEGYSLEICNDGSTPVRNADSIMVADCKTKQ